MVFRTTTELLKALVDAAVCYDYNAERAQLADVLLRLAEVELSLGQWRGAHDWARFALDAAGQDLDSSRVRHTL